MGQVYRLGTSAPARQVSHIDTSHLESFGTFGTPFYFMVWHVYYKVKNSLILRQVFYKINI